MQGGVIIMAPQSILMPLQVVISKEIVKGFIQYFIHITVFSI